jgi:hypothetical protein
LWYFVWGRENVSKINEVAAALSHRHLRHIRACLGWGLSQAEHFRRAGEEQTNITFLSKP